MLAASPDGALYVSRLREYDVDKGALEDVRVFRDFVTDVASEVLLTFCEHVGDFVKEGVVFDTLLDALLDIWIYDHIRSDYACSLSSFLFVVYLWHDLVGLDLREII